MSARNRLIRTLLLFALLPLLFAVVSALEVPFLSGRIVDNAHILSASTVAELESRLKAYEDSTTNQFAVLIISSLEGESLEEYSLRVAETWKLGKKDVSNGALLLIAKEDRKLRIEVGYGLEASLTDAMTSYIINREITPQFKSGNFDEGVRAGVNAMIAAADGKLDTSTVSASTDMEWWFPVIFLAIWFTVIGAFTMLALFSEGCIGWFLYAFLIPFYTAPVAILATVDLWWIGLIILLVYLIGFPIFKVVAAKTPWGKKMAVKYKSRTGRGGAWRSSGWSSGSSGFSSDSSWSSGGSSFSGGGGSFGGGGSSGSW